MGTCYYLMRCDTRTTYALGKAHFLRRVFGNSPMRLTVNDIDTLVALVLAAQRGDLDLEHDVSLHRVPDEADETYTYWRAVSADVVGWSDGKLFEFHSEDGMERLMLP